MRKVRSFVRRPGRITPAQNRALARLLPVYGIPFEQRRLDLRSVFQREAPRVLDIGFGDGEALLTLAANHPGIDYVGVEVHEPGIGHLLLLLERAQLRNVRVIAWDAVEVLEHMLENECVDAVNLFFPDPWPKKRHHKRRLVQLPFVHEVARILTAGGLFHVATDWIDYAEHVVASVAKSARFAAEGAGNLCNNPLALRPPTKFERRGRRLGHDVIDLCYRKESAPSHVP